MLKVKMENARKCIQNKQYDEARRVLRTIDHPKAREWLAKLEQVNRRKRKARRRWIAAGVISLTLVVIAVVAVVSISNQRKYELGVQTQSIVVQFPMSKRSSYGTSTSRQRHHDRDSASSNPK